MRDQMNLPQTFSLIVPTFNRLAGLACCLQGIAALDYPREHFQVIVVNDGGAAVPPALLREYEKMFELCMVSQPNRGPSAARNSGVKYARFPRLVFLDDDCVPAAEWLMEYANAAQAFPDALLGGETRNGLRENMYAEASQCLFGFLYAYYHQTAVARAQLAFFTSNNVAMPLSAFRALNGFDETMRFAEDRDFCARALDAGFPLRYIPTARVLHYRELNLQSFWRQHELYGSGAFQFHHKRVLSRGFNIQIEPLRFYLELLRYPLRYAPRAKWRVLLLLALSQGANLFGFLRARHAHNSSTAQNSL